MKKIILILLCLAMIIPQTACGKEESVSKEGEYLDTECTVTIYNIDKSEGNKLAQGALDLCGEYEKMFSKTIEGSDVDKINAAKGKAVEVNEETIELIQLGIKISKLTDGAFDITVGRLTDIWDFKAETPKVPSDADIKEAVATVGYENIVIKGKTVRLKNKGTKIDLGAIAKGYIADKVSAYLVDAGVHQAIVNLGGNVVAIGQKNESEKWNIGVETPYSDRTDITGSIPAADQALVTSGIYERKFEVGGKLYHHIINPKTGYPVENDVLAVTIVGDIQTSAWCDALSTASLLLGIDKGKALVDSQDGYEAVFTSKKTKFTLTDKMVFNEVSK